MTAPVILWFRQDLRLQDNPALAAACARGGAVLPLYIADETGEGAWRMGGASRWWLHHSLKALDVSLREHGSRLLIARGETGSVLRRVLNETGATGVYWNRRYEPAVVARDKTLKHSLSESGVDAKSFNGALLFEPHAVANRQGNPFQVFTPYWRHCLTLPVEDPLKLPPPGGISPPKQWPATLTVKALELLPKLNWADGFGEIWQPGEKAAQTRLKQFLARAVDEYAEQRNQPDRDGTSLLSPHLHFGELSPRQIWAAVRDLGKESGVFPGSNGERVFLSEVGWREFAHHLLYHFPRTPTEPLRAQFAKFPWADDPQNEMLRRWQRGLTGYPIVDAGMRQLWRTGWMHNRVRMIAGSFLVKHLRLPWSRGAEWFWDTLVDADLANNTLGWQWTAGCGADAAPYFRIFAPVTQGERFDTAGHYVRRWVPELEKLPSKYIHRPWEAPEEVRTAAGVRLGVHYPRPMVDHATARAEALSAFQQLKGIS